MKKTLWSILAVLLTAAMLLTAASCGKKEPTGKTEAPTAAADNGTTAAPDDSNTPDAGNKPAAADDGLTQEKYDAMTADELIDLFVKDRNDVQQDEFAALLNTYRFTTVEDSDKSMEMAFASNITSDAVKSLKEGGCRPTFSGSVAALFGSESAQVRAGVLDSLSIQSKDEQKALLDALSAETDPFVLFVAADHVTLDTPEGKAFMLELAKNDNHKVRLNTVTHLSSPDADTEVLDALIALIGDENKDVQNQACYWAGNTYNEAIIEPLTAVLNDWDAKENHWTCLYSFATLWCGRPFFSHTSEKAYNAMMDYLKALPENASKAAGNSLGGIIDNDIKTDSAEYAEWIKTATYFDTDEIFDALRNILLAEKAGPVLKANVFKPVKALCGAEKLESLRADIEGMDGSTKDILIRQLDSALGS